MESLACFYEHPGTRLVPDSRRTQTVLALIGVAFFDSPTKRVGPAAVGTVGGIRNRPSIRMAFNTNGYAAEKRIVIAGAGRVGHRAARILEGYGHDVHLIDTDPAAVERASKLDTTGVIEGDATDPDILEQTRPEAVDVLAALTGDGQTNGAICATMSHLTDDIRTVARIDDPTRTLDWPDCVDELAYPERAGAKSVVDPILSSDVRTFEEAPADLDILELRVDPRAPVARKRLRAVDLPDGSRMIADSRGSEIARPNMRFEPGKKYLVAAKPAVADDVCRLLTG